MARFTGAIEKADYSELHRISGFEGSLEDYIKHHKLSNFQVSFDEPIAYKNGAMSAGAFVSPEQAKTLAVGQRVSGEAFLKGGGAHVKSFDGESNA